MGGVSYVSLDPSGKSVRGVVVASEMGVLAVLDPHHGDIRRLLGNSHMSLTNAIHL